MKHIMLAIVHSMPDSLLRMRLTLIVYPDKGYMQQCTPLLKARMNLLLKLIPPADFSYIKKKEEVYKIIHILELVPIIIYRFVVFFRVFTAPITIVLIYAKGVHP